MVILIAAAVLKKQHAMAVTLPREPHDRPRWIMGDDPIVSFPNTAYPDAHFASMGREIGKHRSVGGYTGRLFLFVSEEYVARDEGVIYKGGIHECECNITFACCQEMRYTIGMKDLLAPQQQRSRETLARLLRATVEMLEKHGLAGATIPRIAAVAGVAPASVYRRFKDRDALYRAAFLSALQRDDGVSEKTLSLDAFKDPTFEGVVGNLVTIILRQYRTHPRLLTALVRYMEDDTDKRFKKKALALVAGNFEMLVDLLLNFRSEIGHSDPRRAITFGLLSVVSSIEVRALGEVSLWREVLPVSDQELHPELTRILISYLRAKPGSHRGT